MKRFDIGKTYLFARFLFNGTNGKVVSSHSPISWGGLTLDKCEFITLTCIAEKEVPVAYSEAKGFGYIFGRPNEDGVLTEYWHNQYPVASYGQISTIGDSLVHENTGKYDYADFIRVDTILTDILFNINRNKTQTESGRTHLHKVWDLLIEGVKEHGFSAYKVPLLHQGIKDWTYSKVRVQKPDQINCRFVIESPQQSKPDWEQAAKLWGLKEGTYETSMKNPNSGKHQKPEPVVMGETSLRPTVVRLPAISTKYEQIFYA